MSKESLLKKEFKEKDVQRVRNLVNKDFTSKTTTGIGYTKKQEFHEEGDIWEEGGKQWTIKNGIRQNITKLDAAKKALRIPLTCPKCSGSMKHHLSKKMYKIHGFCFDCTVEYETELKKSGLYQQYEKSMVTGNVAQFANDIEAWLLEQAGQSESFITEDGTIEEWKSNSGERHKKLTSNLQDFIKHLRDKI